MPTWRLGSKQGAVTTTSENIPNKINSSAVKRRSWYNTGEEEGNRIGDLYETGKIVSLSNFFGERTFCALLVVNAQALRKRE